MEKRYRVILMTAILLIGVAVWLPGLRPRRVTAQSAGLIGSYGFTAIATNTLGNNNANANTFALIGVITLDGAGTFTGNQTVVLQDTAPNATTVQTDTQTLAGTYTVNPNGSGSLAIQNPRGPIPVAFVITDGGSGFMFVQTGGGNFLLTGTGRKQ